MDDWKEPFRKNDGYHKPRGIGTKVIKYFIWGTAILFIVGLWAWIFSVVT